MKNTAVPVYLFMMVCAAAHATDYRCLPFDSHLENITDCDTVDDGWPSDVRNGSFNVEWEQNCTYSGNSADVPSSFQTHVYVNGIAQCGRDMSEDISEVTEHLHQDAFYSVFCYCKLTYPFVSQWVASGNWDGYGAVECRRNCAAQCARAFAEEPSFRDRLITNLSPMYAFSNDMPSTIEPAEYFEFFDLTGDEWRTGVMNTVYNDIIEPNRCPYGSSVFALKHLTLDRICDINEDGSKLAVGKRRTCLETSVYEEAGYSGTQVREQYSPISDCSMYIPDHNKVYGLEWNLIGVEGTSINNPEETFYYYSVCGLSEG